MILELKRFIRYLGTSSTHEIKLSAFDRVNNMFNAVLSFSANF